MTAWRPTGTTAPSSPCRGSARAVRRDRRWTSAGRRLRSRGVLRRRGARPVRGHAGRAVSCRWLLRRGAPPRAGESVRGSVTPAPWQVELGGRVVLRGPRSVWWRKKERMAATRRAIVAGESPAARSSARYCSSCSVVILPTGRSSQTASALRSRRYASTVFGARRVASSARKPSASGSTGWCVHGCRFGVGGESPPTERFRRRGAANEIAVVFAPVSRPEQRNDAPGDAGV